MQGGLPEGEVGVVAPFRRQVALLRALCPPAVEVGTVDQFQGKERAAMLLSCTVARAATSAQVPARLPSLGAIVCSRVRRYEFTDALAS